MLLRQPGFILFIILWTFYDKRRKNPKIDSQYVYQNELNNSCSQHDIANGDFKDLTRGKASDKTLHDKAFNIVKNAKYNGYQCRIALMVYKFFDKKNFW